MWLSHYQINIIISVMSNIVVYFFIFLFIYFKKILEDISPFCGPCFGLLVTSPLSFDTWGGSLLHTWQRHICVACSLRLTSGVTPTDFLVARMAAESVSSTFLWAGIGGLKARIYVLQTNALPTGLCWLGLLYTIFIGYMHFETCGIFCPVIRFQNTEKLKSHFSIYFQEDSSQVPCIKKSHVSIQGWLQSDVKISLTRMRYDLGDLWF